MKPRRALVTGASGFIGRALTKQLTREGIEVVALTRNPSRAKASNPLLSEIFPWDINEGPPRPEFFWNVDAVIHLAGEPIAGRWKTSKKDAISSSRVLGTRHLVEGISRAPKRPAALISASAIGYYGNQGEQELIERDRPGKDFMGKVCTAWEAEASAAEELGVRVARLRFGIVLGAKGGAMVDMLSTWRRGFGGTLGTGRQWWSWVHINDAVGLILHSLFKDIYGPMNVTSPNPIRQREFSNILSDALDVSAFMRTPAWLLKLTVGDFATELLASKRVVPERGMRTGYRFMHPELDVATLRFLASFG
jgi:uncharacterized protein